MAKKEKITIYEKPTCSTCRAVLKTLKEKGVEYEAMNYYEKPFTKESLKELIDAMGMSPRELLRTKEKIYKQLGFAVKEYTDDEIIRLMAEHPDLIQRPIVVKGKKVMLARPPETIEEII